MVNFNITMNQAILNMQVLHNENVVFTSDKKGNLSLISKFNLLGRFFNFIANLIEGSGEHKVNKVILATLQTINQQAQKNSDKPVWTYPYEQSGKDFDIGFDKVAMRILLDRSRFSASYYHSSENKSDDTRIKIRKVAHEVLVMATDQRKKMKIDFDCDHLNT